MGRCDDPRLVVGATVHAKAVHIVHYAECARLDGSLAGTKLVSGTVASVTRQVTNGRSMTGSTATWDLASGTVSCAVNKCVETANARGRSGVGEGV